MHLSVCLQIWIPLSIIIANPRPWHPHRRLFTGHMVWPTATSTLHEYVRLACGTDPQLFPTLLGLRLMNDPLVRAAAAGSMLST